MDKKIDEIEHEALGLIPMKSLSLRLVRSTIKMNHDPKWRVEKLNPTHDLVICLTGRGEYEIEGRPGTVSFEPGQAMLIPAYKRFRGRYAGDGEIMTGVAQHFTLDLFERGDLIRQMKLKDPVWLKNWDALEPMVQLYRKQAPAVHTTLSQHHQFMVFLLAYFDAAFEGWKTEENQPESQDHLSMQIMLIASRLSADPLGSGSQEALDDVPYNADYFRRAFKERIGYTPQKFRELKRMEFAANRLATGMTVKSVAAELGYTDPYFFSRLFKRYLGASPSTFIERPSQSRPPRRRTFT